uniref:Uncharacterized protein n=1 Tax=Aegilops tauschii subsp. strangulata TaxID=200361 RepID=A0A452YHQ0_AEGTS
MASTWSGPSSRAPFPSPRTSKWSTPSSPMPGSSPVPYNHDLVSSTASYSDEWHADLLGCCSEPALYVCLLVSECIAEI